MKLPNEGIWSLLALYFANAVDQFDDDTLERVKLDDAAVELRSFLEKHGTTTGTLTTVAGSKRVKVYFTAEIVDGDSE